MAVVTIGSAKGSPGVSLAAWGLGHCWPRPIVGVELDGAGGTWAYRHGLTCEPGLPSLAATTEPLDMHVASAHGQEVLESRWFVCAPKEGAIVRAAQGWLDERLLAWPENDDLLIDVGRFRAGEVQHSAPVRRCDALLLMTGTRAEELATTASVIGDVVKAMRPGATLYLLYVASGPYSASEATDSLNELVKRRLFRIAGTIPYDPKAAATLCNGGRNAGKIATRWFGSIASELAASTAHRTLGATVHAASAAEMNGVA